MSTIARKQKQEKQEKTLTIVTDGRNPVELRGKAANSMINASRSAAVLGDLCKNSKDSDKAFLERTLLTATQTAFKAASSGEKNAVRKGLGAAGVLPPPDIKPKATNLISWD